MTRLHEVMHLVRYDVLRLKWWWAGYALLLVALYWSAWAMISSRTALLGMIPLSAMFSLFCCAFSAMLTINDSPHDHRAFLHTKPVRPFVRAVSVIASAVMLVASAAVVSALVVSRDGIVASSYLSIMPFPIVAQLLAVLAGMLIGCMVKKLSSAFLVWLGALAAVPPMAWLFSKIIVPSQDTGTFYLVITLLVAIVALGAILRLGNARPAKVRAVIVGIPAAALAILGQCNYVPPLTDWTRTPAFVTASVPLTERATITELPRRFSKTASIRIGLSGTAGDRTYAVRSARLRMVTTKGTISRSLRSGMLVGDAEQVVGAERLGENASKLAPLSRDAFFLTGDLSAGSPAEQVQSVEIDFTLVRYRVQRVFERRLRIGEVFKEAGDRVGIVRDGTDIALKYTTYGDAPPPLLDGMWQEGRPVPALLTVSDSSTGKSYALRSVGGSIDTIPMVLPALRRTARTETIEHADLLEPLLANNARSAMVLYRWIEEGRERVTVKRDVERPAMGSTR